MHIKSDHPLALWRREHGVTLAGMAERAGSTAATISRIEHDKTTPSYRLARRLGMVTGLSAETFLDRINDPAADDDGASPG